jgi:ubiquinone/menaquinone biosynthesis C-methylase UbiE
MTITAITRVASNVAAPWKTAFTEVLCPAEGYDRWAGTYDSGLNPLLALEERCVFPLLPPLQNLSVLDLACGTGRWFDFLVTRGASNLVGVDLSMRMLSVSASKRNCRSKLVRADISYLPFPASHFDFAICSFAVGHVSDLGLFARECRRVLKPKASLWVTDVHPEAYKAGWRTGFRDQSGRVEIETVARTTAELVGAFRDAEFQSAELDQFTFGLAEKTIFLQSGRIRSFPDACRTPAILMCQFR